jgi:hypothetical protein
MEGFIFRPATIEDTPFLVETIIHAEKSGTDVFTYNTIFGLSEFEARKYITAMLEEEIDGCELSVSSFFVAEFNKNIVAALSSWVEGSEGISSSELKGNLMSYVLPSEAIKRAISINPIVNQIHIDYIPGTIQKGAGYVVSEFRKRELFGILTEKLIGHLVLSNPEVSEVYTHVFSNNLSAIKANEKIGFKIVDKIRSNDKRILSYLPFNEKLLLKKEL